MDYACIENQITKWLSEKLDESKQKGFVIGVSGGVDSAVVSTLCAKTGKPTILVSLPIGAQNTYIADKHIEWLLKKYPNVKSASCNLGQTVTQFKNSMWEDLFKNNTYTINTNENRNLVSANLQSRIRMCALYAFANASGFLVVGTGNKIEDFGIGFFTKNGDGAIDISPIGDLLKSEVKKLAAHLGVMEEIILAAPTDGLWVDGRTDENQIGATYDELEWAMREYGSVMRWYGDIHEDNLDKANFDERQKQVLRIYHQRHTANKHKMSMPPVCLVVRKREI